jgi:hypothetical protein
MERARGATFEVVMLRSIAAACVLLAAIGCASAAQASKKVYSYDSADPTTEAMTEAGLTFVFDKSLMGERVLSIMETHDIGQADVRPASEGELGPGGLDGAVGHRSHERELYEILPAGQGKALVKALCPGASRAWLAFSPLRPDELLHIDAIARDPATGRSHLCIALEYQFHGEWTPPVPELPQPDRSDRFNDAPANRRY